MTSFSDISILEGAINCYMNVVGTMKHEQITKIAMGESYYAKFYVPTGVGGARFVTRSGWVAKVGELGFYVIIEYPPRAFCLNEELPIKSGACATGSIFPQLKNFYFCGTTFALS